MDKKQRYIFIDVETTGLDPYDNDVIEIAALVYDEDQEIARYVQKVVADDGTIDLQALKVNGRSIFTVVPNNHPEDKHSLGEIDYAFRRSAVLGFADFLLEYMTKDTFVVGHNVYFDYQFIKAMFQNRNIDSDRLLNTYHLVDTKTLAKFLHDSGELDLENYRMITLWNALFEGEGEYREDNAHSAMIDAIMVKDIYFKLRN